MTTSVLLTNTGKQGFEFLLEKVDQFQGPNVDIDTKSRKIYSGSNKTQQNVLASNSMIFFKI